jgi:arylsulfatase A-like enzyme
MSRTLRVAGLLVALLPLVSAAATKAVAPAVRRPNVLIWLMDDVGFGQPSPFGGPVEMPTLQAIADQGLRFTNFHSTAICSSSRVALLNGRNHHALGMGNHAGLVSGDPGYTAKIPRSAASLATILHENGYSTWALGKWDQFPNEDATPDGPYQYWPSGQGFERFYGFLFADMDHFHPTLWRGHEPLETPHDPNYHLTVDLADQAIQYLRDQQAVAPDKPFFLYWATGAAHAPHHAPLAWREKYRGHFDLGWDQQRQQTLAREKALGIVPNDVELPPRPDYIPAWASMTPDERRLAARSMEAFAAQLAHADYEFGRIVEELRREGRLNDTMIIIMSDNGASGEGGPSGTFNEWRAISGIPTTLAQNLAHYDDWGGPSTYPHYSVGWAMAGNTPFKYYKTMVHMGGVRGPMVISWPNGIPAHGGLRGQFHHLIDVMPTVLEAAGIAPPATVDGVAQQALDGTSFLYAMRDAAAPTRHRKQYFEMFGNRAMVDDGWKAVVLHRKNTWDFFRQWKFEDDVWELYNVDRDTNEMHDVAGEQPAKLAELQAEFDAEARRNHVYPLGPDFIKYKREQMARQLADRNDVFKYTGVVRGISNDAAPPTVRLPWDLTAAFDAAGPRTRAFVAHGGAMGGYSLYLKDGIPAYCYNFLGSDLTCLRGTTALAAGRHELRVQFRPDADGGAGISLQVDGGTPLQGRIPKIMPFIYEASDGFSIGLDQGSSVSPDTVGAVPVEVIEVRFDFPRPPSRS